MGHLEQTSMLKDNLVSQGDPGLQQQPTVLTGEQQLEFP